MSGALYVLWVILVLGFSAFGLFILAALALASRDRDRSDDEEDGR